MKIIIYQYPHPIESDKWVYTGQTTNLTRRDKQHREMIKGFGRRFQKLFPSTKLPQPNFKEIEVIDYLEANEEETIAIFRNHTWHGQGGMNLTLPNSEDYKNLGGIGGRKGGLKQGPIQGKINSENGHMSRIGKGGTGGRIGGKIGGAKTASIPEHMSKAGRIGGKIGGRISGLMRKETRTGIFGRTAKQMSMDGCKGPHARFHAGREKPSPKCVFCCEQNLVIAYA